MIHLHWTTLYKRESRWMLSLSHGRLFLDEDSEGVYVSYPNGLLDRIGFLNAT